MSVIVVMVLVHPTLTRRSVQLLTCDELGADDPRRYLRKDLQIVCWESSHLAWALTIGIPFLILYALGIPMVSLYVMFKRKHKLHKIWPPCLGSVSLSGIRKTRLVLKGSVRFFFSFFFVCRFSLLLLRIICFVVIVFFFPHL